LVMLLRLRQACLHPMLVLTSKNVVHHHEDLCPICNDPFDSPVSTPCKHVFCRNCIETELMVNDGCPTCKKDVRIEKLTPAGLNTGSTAQELKLELTSSTKVDRLLELLAEQQLKEPGSKCIIFSQFTSFLNLIELPLKTRKMTFTRLDGSMQIKTRNVALELFKQSKDVNIILMSLKAGGLGLNLVQANYVYMMDPWWNPYVEDQAIDRAHRMGQSKPVTVVRFTIEGTIESRILELQENKRLIAEGALGRGGRTNLNSLSVQELMHIFRD